MPAGELQQFSVLRTLNMIRVQGGNKYIYRAWFYIALDCFCYADIANVRLITTYHVAESPGMLTFSEYMELMQNLLVSVYEKETLVLSFQDLSSNS